MASTTLPCASCANRARFHCSRCATAYCTDECRRAHWSEHKPSCQRLAAAIDTATRPRLPTTTTKNAPADKPTTPPQFSVEAINAAAVNSLNQRALRESDAWMRGEMDEMATVLQAAFSANEIEDIRVAVKAVGLKVYGLLEASTGPTPCTDAECDSRAESLVSDVKRLRDMVANRAVPGGADRMQQNELDALVDMAVDGLYRRVNEQFDEDVASGEFEKRQARVAGCWDDVKAAFVGRDDDNDASSAADAPSQKGRDKSVRASITHLRGMASRRTPPDQPNLWTRFVDEVHARINSVTGDKVVRVLYMLAGAVFVGGVIGASYKAIAYSVDPEVGLREVRAHLETLKAHTVSAEEASRQAEEFVRTGAAIIRDNTQTFVNRAEMFKRITEETNIDSPTLLAYYKRTVETLLGDMRAQEANILRAGSDIPPEVASVLDSWWRRALRATSVPELQQIAREWNGSVELLTSINPSNFVAADAAFKTSMQSALSELSTVKGSLDAVLEDANQLGAAVEETARRVALTRSSTPVMTALARRLSRTIFPVFGSMSVETFIQYSVCQGFFTLEAIFSSFLTDISAATSGMQYASISFMLAANLASGLLSGQLTGIFSLLLGETSAELVERIAKKWKKARDATLLQEGYTRGWTDFFYDKLLGVVYGAHDFMSAARGAIQMLSFSKTVLSVMYAIGYGGMVGALSVVYINTNALTITLGAVAVTAMFRAWFCKVHPVPLYSWVAPYMPEILKYGPWVARAIVILIPALIYVYNASIDQMKRITTETVAEFGRREQDVARWLEAATDINVTQVTIAKHNLMAVMGSITLPSADARSLIGTNTVYVGNVAMNTK